MIEEVGNFLRTSNLTATFEWTCEHEQREVCDFVDIVLTWENTHKQFMLSNILPINVPKGLQNET